MPPSSSTRISARGFGPAKKNLAELGDDELEREARQRRRARKSDESPREPERGAQRGATRRADKRRRSADLSRYYANLELEAGATLEEVRAAYERLMAKYHPEKFTDDPAKRRMAGRLADSLTSAYRALDDYLSRP